MIDLGDLREGIWPHELLPTVERIMELPGVRIAGVGTNLTCFGAIVPTEDNLGQLVAHAYKVERVTGTTLDWVSGGNSSSLPLLLAGRMPHGINNLRVGEAILQGGRDTFLDAPWSELDRDAFHLTGELLEVKVKPSMPIGKSGIDAFGQRPYFIDEGDRLRGIANIGREDVIVEGLSPTHQGVRVLGASSDHLVLDLTDAEPPLGVGDLVSFRMSYGAMLAAMTSEYVEKVPMREVEEVPGPKRVSIVASQDTIDDLKEQSLEARLQGMGFEVSRSMGSCLREAAAAAMRDGAIALHLGPDRKTAGTALEAGTIAEDAIGLIWIDSHAAMMPDQEAAQEAPERSALARALARLMPRLSPENVVLVGLREADPVEAQALKASRVTVFTMVEIDATGIREVMREALKIASAGTRGFAVCYSPTATDIPGWPLGSGGMTVRETHQAMEAVARHGGLRSIAISGLSRGQDSRIAAESAHFVMSALGKRIL
jgi:hypothetical protein